MYEIIISKLTFKTIIGILDFERIKPQKVRVNCRVSYKKKEDFIDYAKVSKFIKSTMKDKKFKLIEDAVDDLSASLIKEYPQIIKLKLKISKPDILKNCKVSVKKVTQKDTL